MLYKNKEFQIKQNETQNYDLTELIIVKQRNGPLGTIKLKFDPNKTKAEVSTILLGLQLHFA